MYSSVASAKALGGKLIDTGWPAKVYRLRGPAVGQPGSRHAVRLRGMAAGHVPASQGLTKCGPLEKGLAKHFSILALKTP